MLKLFLDGGAFYMGLLTVELIALLLAAWKAPGWVKEAGLIALSTGCISFMMGVTEIATSMLEAGDSIPGIIAYAGLKVALISLIYGCLIYVVSLIIRVIQKPRLL